MKKKPLVRSIQSMFPDLIKLINIEGNDEESIKKIDLNQAENFIKVCTCESLENNTIKEPR